ncbi:MAG: hypothetical protein HZC40_00860 [Chloroflexi bacterium]|nr:hypothetical protein [Chloroflexota bacterium]
MDIATLAKDLTVLLVPFLPYLIKAGEKALEKTGEQIGEKLIPDLGKETWDRVQALWSRLQPKVQARPALQEAAQDVAIKPDEDAVASLRLQLKKLLTDDAALVAELSRLMSDAERAGIIQNVLQHGKYNINIGKADHLDIGDKN